MKLEIICRMEMLQAVGVFAAKYGGAAPGSRLARLFARAAEIEAKLSAAGAKQHGEHASFRAAAAQRLSIATSLREWMSDVARVARSLPPEEEGSLREYFRLPRSQSYVALRTHAVAFIRTLETVKDVFLECGFEEDFIARAEALIAQMDEAGGLKIGSYGKRVGETKRLLERSREGLAIVAQIHAILCLKLKSNASLLAAWESARRVHRKRAGENANAPAVADAITRGVAADRSKSGVETRDLACGAIPSGPAGSICPRSIFRCDSGAIRGGLAGPFRAALS